MKAPTFDAELLEAVSVVCCRYGGKVGVLAEGITPEVLRELSDLFDAVGVAVRHTVGHLRRPGTLRYLATYDQLIFEAKAFSVQLVTP